MKHSSGNSLIGKLMPLLVISLFTTQVVIAQSDSINVKKAKWKVEKLAPGIRLKHCWFEHSLFGSNQNINILEVKLNHKNKIDVAADPKQLIQTSKFGSGNQALAAINGTFFDMKNGGSVDYIRIDGKMLNTTRVSKTNGRSLHQKSAIIIDGKTVAIKAWDGTPDWEERLNGEDVMVTGPLLITDGQRAALDTGSMYSTRHPRTAIAIKGNKLLMITVDGRNERAAGMSLYELASLLKWIGSNQGINLDGGGSTTLWVSGYPEGGIVNYPSDNIKMMQSAAYKPGMDLDNLAAKTQKLDRSGERPVANVLLVSRKKR